MDVHLVAIVGGSGSGKTWLAGRLLEEFGDIAGRISLDDFYRDLSHLPAEDRERTDFDRPDAIDWPLFRRCLAAVRAGEATGLPVYDFATHTRRPMAREWRPRRLVLVEGLWLLRPAGMRRLYSASVFVECPEHVRLARRIARDAAERGRSVRSVRSRFERQVAPMHDRFVAGQARTADLRVGSPVPPAAMAALIARLQALSASEVPE